MPLEMTGEPAFGQVVRQMTRMMDQMQKGFFAFNPADTFTPAVNLYETESAYLVCVDLAGVEKGKIDLEVTADKLRLRGQRAVPVPVRPAQATSQRLRVHLMEIDHGGFCREVPLPESVDPDNVTANYENGLLWIELPKR